MFVETNGVHINIRERGNGETALLFLHYWGGSSRTWEQVISALPEHYRRIALDLRGWGDSAKPPTGYAIADLADDVQGVIEALDLRRYILIGHSMGGKVAQLLASRRPPGLEGLVLVASSPPVPMGLSDDERGRMARAYDSADSIGFVLDNVLTATPLNGTLRNRVIEDSLRGAAAAKTGWPQGAMLEDISGHVSSINVPTVILAGELDKVDSVATLRQELLPRIANARMQVLPGVGHLSLLEAPLAVAQGILGLIEDIANGGRQRK